MKTSFVFALILTSATGLYGTYAGSVVSSFYAEPLEWEGQYYYAFGLTYGDGHVWVVYAHGVITKRTTRGSIVSSFDPDIPLWRIGWDDRRGYIYGTSWYDGVFWLNASTGSLVGSFGMPPGAARLWGLEYDSSTPGHPVWVCQLQQPYAVWNLTGNGGVVSSFSIVEWLYGPRCLAMDAVTSGGPFLFVGTQSAPPTIYVVRPSSFSIISSFVAPVHNYGICDLSWDGQYLWVVENGRETPPNEFGMVYRCVGHTTPSVTPASVGRIKTLFR